MLDDLALEAAGARAALAEVSDNLTAILEEQDTEAPHHVCWAETWRADWGDCWRLCAAPVRVGIVPDIDASFKDQIAIFTRITTTIISAYIHGAPLWLFLSGGDWWRFGC